MTDLHLSAPAGTLQVRPVWQDSDTLVVICHPHPLFGGTMDNKVVTTLARYWRARGHSVVLFNFRGVGSSTGTHDNGLGEVDDLRTVLAWAVQQTPARQLILAGFSFGAYIAAAGADRLSGWALDDVTLARLVLVAPAVHHYPMQTLNLPADTLVLIGDQDEIVPPHAVHDWAVQQQLNAVTMPACSHFFHGHLADLGVQLERHRL
jgi:alpha/beta superfamily hydrolase